VGHEPHLAVFGQIVRRPWVQIIRKYWRRNLAGASSRHCKWPDPCKHVPQDVALGKTFDEPPVFCLEARVPVNLSKIHLEGAPVLLDRRLERRVARLGYARNLAPDVIRQDLHAKDPKGVLDRAHLRYDRLDRSVLFAHDTRNNQPAHIHHDKVRCGKHLPECVQLYPIVFGRVIVFERNHNLWGS